MRYLPQTKKSREDMLAAIGVKAVDELFRDVPKAAFIDGKAKIADHMGEIEMRPVAPSLYRRVGYIRPNVLPNSYCG